MLRGTYLTPEYEQELLSKLEELLVGYCESESHLEADFVLMDALETLGYTEIIKAYRRVGKRYA